MLDARASKLMTGTHARGTGRSNVLVWFFSETFGEGDEFVAGCLKFFDSVGDDLVTVEWKTNSW